MKKKIALILALVMAVSVAGTACNNDDAKSSDATTSKIESSASDSSYESTTEASETTTAPSETTSDTTTTTEATTTTTTEAAKASESTTSATSATTKEPEETSPKASEPEESTSASEEPSEDKGGDNYYSAVTALGKEEVEKFALEMKTAYLNKDWKTIAAHIHYPINANNEKKCSNADEFINYMKDKKIVDADLKEMQDEDCKDLFFNGQGICLGTGQIWMVDFNSGSPKLEIITVCGLE